MAGAMVRKVTPVGSGGRGVNVTARGHGSASGPQRVASARVIQGLGSTRHDLHLLQGEGLPRREPEAHDHVVRARRVGRRRRQEAADAQRHEVAQRRTRGGAARPSRGAPRRPWSAARGGACDDGVCRSTGSTATGSPASSARASALPTGTAARCASTAIGVPGAPNATKRSSPPDCQSPRGSVTSSSHDDAIARRLHAHARDAGQHRQGRAPREPDMGGGRRPGGAASVRAGGGFACAVPATRSATRAIRDAPHPSAPSNARASASTPRVERLPVERLAGRRRRRRAEVRPRARVAKPVHVEPVAQGVGRALATRPGRRSAPARRRARPATRPRRRASSGAPKSRAAQLVEELARRRCRVVAEQQARGMRGAPRAARAGEDARLAKGRFAARGPARAPATPRPPASAGEHEPQAVGGARPRLAGEREGHRRRRRRESRTANPSSPSARAKLAAPSAAGSGGRSSVSPASARREDLLAATRRRDAPAIPRWRRVRGRVQHRRGAAVAATRVLPHRPRQVLGRIEAAAAPPPRSAPPGSDAQQVPRVLAGPGGARPPHASRARRARATPAPRPRPRPPRARARASAGAPRGGDAAPRLPPAREPRRIARGTRASLVARGARPRHVVLAARGAPASARRPRGRARRAAAPRPAGGASPRSASHVDLPATRRTRLERVVVRRAPPGRARARARHRASAVDARATSRSSESRSSTRASAMRVRGQPWMVARDVPRRASRSRDRATISPSTRRDALEPRQRPRPRSPPAARVARSTKVR